MLAFRLCRLYSRRLTPIGLIWIHKENNIEDLEAQKYQEEEQKFQGSLVQQVRWNSATDSVLKVSSERSLTEQQKIDYRKVQVDDPDLLTYTDLVQKYHPQTLLEKYQSMVKRAKIKYERETNSEVGYQCKIKFYTQERVLEAIGRHPTDTMLATLYACQRMLRFIFPKIHIWIELINFIDAIPNMQVIQSLIE